MMPATPIIHRAAKRALLLDFDGTLADTILGLRQVYERFLDRLNVRQHAPSFEEANGMVLSELIQGLCRQFATASAPEAEWQSYRNGVEAAILEAAPMPGTHALIAWAKQQGWLVGIASAGQTALIADWLRRHELAMAIDEIVGADLCPRGKPDPALYQLLIGRLDVAPQDCIAIEDSPAGIASALAAGIDVIHLRSGEPGKDGNEALLNVGSLADALTFLQRRFPPIGHS